jgi:hypothetical protein
LIVSNFVIPLTLVNVSATDLPQFNIEGTCRAAPTLQGGIQTPFENLCGGGKGGTEPSPPGITENQIKGFYKEPFVIP